MSKKILWTITFVFSLMFNQAIFADSAICGLSLSKMVQSLNLDDSQKTKIKPILDQLKSTMKTTGSQMDSLEDQFNQQLTAPSMDQSKVSDLVDQKTKLIGDSMKARMMAIDQISAVLKPEQKTKLQTMIKKAHEKIAAEFKKCDE